MLLDSACRYLVFFFCSVPLSTPADLTERYIDRGRSKWLRIYLLIFSLTVLVVVVVGVDYLSLATSSFCPSLFVVVVVVSYSCFLWLTYHTDCDRSARLSQASLLAWGFLLPRTNGRAMKVVDDDPLLTVSLLFSFLYPSFLVQRLLFVMDEGTRKRRLRWSRQLRRRHLSSVESAQGFRPRSAPSRTLTLSARWRKEWDQSTLTSR